MPMNAGSASVTIFGNTKPFEGSLVRARVAAGKFDKSMGRSLSGVTGGFNRATASVGRFHKGLIAANGAAGGLAASLGSLRGILGPMAALFGGAFAISTIADFGKSMAGLEAVTKASGAEMEKMTALARELGGTTEFTAAQAAEGMRFLGMAGFETSAILETMPAMLDLATAAQLDLGRAADITSNIMTAFGVSASDAVKVADTMAKVASSANTNVEQLGQAMKFAGPVAKATGKDIGDISAAIGVLSDAGMQSTMAGTGLRVSIAKLADPSKKAKKALAALGLTVEDVNPQMNSLVDIADKLAKGGIDLTDAMALAGIRGGNALLNLTANVPKLRKLTESLKDVTGEAKRMANIMRDTLAGDAKIAKSALEDLFLTMGDAGATNALRSAVQGVTSAFRFMSDNIKTIGAIAGGYATLAVLRLVGAIRTATIATTAFTAVLMRNPFGLIGVALATLIALMIQYRDKSVTIGGETVQIGAVMSAVWTTITEAIKGTIVAVMGYAVALKRLVSFNFSGAFAVAKETASSIAESAKKVAAAWAAINDAPPPVNRLGFGGGIAGIGMGGGVPDASVGNNDRGDVNIADPEKYDKAREAIERQVEAMKIEAETYGMSAAAAANYRIQKELELAARQADLTLTPQQIEQNRSLAESFGEVTAQLEGMRVLEELRTPAEAYRMELERLDDLLRRGKISFQEYQAAAALAAKRAGASWEQSASQIIGAIQTVIQASGTQNKKLVAINKAAGIANAIINTHVGITKAYAELSFPANFAVAAAIAAKGFASVAAIQSQSQSTPSAPSVPSASSGQTSQAQDQAQAAPSQTVSITLQGAGSFSPEQVSNLIELINEAVGDGAQLQVTSA